MATIDLAGIPANLKGLRQWVCWRYELRDGKPTKVPYQPNGDHARSNDPATWATYQACIDALPRFDGIGIMFAGGLAGIDIDHCLDDAGNLTPLAREIVDAVPTYWELSPSGTGLHGVFYGTLPPGGRKSTQHGIEMYSEGRYFTVTGQHLDGTPSTVNRLNGEVAKVHARVFGVKPTETPVTRAVSQPIKLDDKALIDKAMSAANGTDFARLWRGDVSAYNGDQSAADQALCNMLAFWTGNSADRIDRLFRQSGLMRPKWDEVHFADGRTYGAGTIAKAIAGTPNTYNPTRITAASAEAVIDDGVPSVPMPADEHAGGPMPATSAKTNGKVKTPTDDELAQRWIDARPLTAYGVGQWRRYAGGVWPIIPVDTIRNEIKGILIAAKSEGVRPTKNLLKSVEELARVSISVPDQEWDSNADVLVCGNGTLRISTRELLPHDPAHHVTERVAFDYDPLATAPTWEYALNSTVPDAANLLQEFAGYCLITDTRHEIALWLYGQPGSGKSTIIEGIVTMLGGRAGVLGLAAIERSQFALTALPGKTLVTSTEQPATFIKSVHVLNSIISGEPTTVERKYFDPFVIVPRAKILWSMNELPRIGEANSGLFRRVKVIEFLPLPEDERDPRIKDEIRGEGAGILNWALAGLDRLRQRGRFDVPSSVVNSTADFKAGNDIPAIFVDEMCVIGPEYRTQSKTLYDAYKAWAYDNGHKAQSSTSLAGDWKRLGFERYRAAGQSFWRGVGLIDAHKPG